MVILVKIEIKMKKTTTKKEYEIFQKKKNPNHKFPLCCLLAFVCFFLKINEFFFFFGFFFFLLDKCLKGEKNKQFPYSFRQLTRKKTILVYSSAVFYNPDRLRCFLILINFLLFDFFFNNNKNNNCVIFVQYRFDDNCILTRLYLSEFI